MTSRCSNFSIHLTSTPKKKKSSRFCGYFSLILHRYNSWQISKFRSGSWWSIQNVHWIQAKLAFSNLGWGNRSDYTLSSFTWRLPFPSWYYASNFWKMALSFYSLKKKKLTTLQLVHERKGGDVRSFRKEVIKIFLTTSVYVSFLYRMANSVHNIYSRYLIQALNAYTLQKFEISFNVYHITESLCRSHEWRQWQFNPAAFDSKSYTLLSLPIIHPHDNLRSLFEIVNFVERFVGNFIVLHAVCRIDLCKFYLK